MVNLALDKPTQPCAARTRGFSLVELVIVIAILGILAAIVVPRFTNASEVARSNALKEDLRILRTQIMVYRAQHNGMPPGYPNGDTSATPTMEAFTNQMTLYSNVEGKTSATPSSQYQLGPYLLKMPVNLVNGSSEIKFIGNSAAFPSAADGTTGWVYQPSTGLFAANASGNDSEGKKYFDY